MFFAQINTDYRLGRFQMKITITDLYLLVLDSKAGQERYLEEGRDIFKNTQKNLERAYEISRCWG